MQRKGTQMTTRRFTFSKDICIMTELRGGWEIEVPCEPMDLGPIHEVIEKDFPEFMPAERDLIIGGVYDTMEKLTLPELLRSASIRGEEGHERIF
jgi:hypothetical protein